MTFILRISRQNLDGEVNENGEEDIACISLLSSTI